jgi:response regulator RpfG family c-di-GMP phosphodiesterase
MPKLKFMIVDDEPEIADLNIFFLMDDFDAEFKTFKNGKEAISYLKELQQKGEAPDICISDMNMPNGNGLLLYQFIRENFPLLPFILTTSDDWQTHQNNFQGPLIGYVQKPNESNAFTVEIKKLLEKKVTPDKPKDSYIGISLDMLKSISRINCLVFLKISDTNYVKVILPETKFDDKLFKKYQDKQVNLLYVNRKDYCNLIHDFVERINSKILMTDFTPEPWEQLQIAENVIEVLNEAVKSFGWSKEAENLAKHNIAIVLSYINSKNSLIELFGEIRKSKSNYLIMHSLLISFIANALLHESNGKEEDSYYLTLASFFHDISLDSQLCKNERNLEAAIKLNMSSNIEEQLLISSHPLVSYEVVDKLNYFPAIVKEIIVQHQEKPDGTGYPKNLTSEAISSLSAVFIIAEELAILFLAQNNHKDLSKIWSKFSTLYSHARFKEYFDIVSHWLNKE